MELDPASTNVLEPQPSGVVEIAKDIEEHAGLPTHTTGADALQAVMCAFARGLDDEKLREVVAALPPDLRPLLQTCPVHRGEVEAVQGEDVSKSVAEHLGMDVRDAQRTAAVVFEAILQRIPLDTADRIVQMLPADVRFPRPLNSEREGET